MSDRFDAARASLRHGAKFPFDAPDAWWEQGSDDGMPPPPPEDWAHAAARGVMADLEDRVGCVPDQRGIDEETRVEMVRALAAIIREAAGKRP